MKLNEHTVLTGNSVVLVPYKEYHVPKYHEWMKSEELQMLTASEPLTIEEEHCMQKSWQVDSDKCTFIVLDKLIYDETKNELQAMVGDTNIFLRREDDLIVGEIEIMIAEISARGKGYGKEAVLLMLRYGLENLGINIYEAKIGINNTKSISLFSAIGFCVVNESTVFQEITLQREVSETWTQWLLCQTRNSALVDFLTLVNVGLTTIAGIVSQFQNFWRKLHNSLLVSFSLYKSLYSQVAFKNPYKDGKTPRTILYFHYLAGLTPKEIDLLKALY